MLTKTIVEFKRLWVSKSYAEEYAGNFDVAIVNGKYYSDKSPGLSFISIPLYVVGKFVASFIQFSDKTYSNVDSWAIFWILISVSAISALGVLRSHDICRLLGCSRASSVITAFVLAFGTVFWVYSATLFAHSVVASFWSFGLYHLIKAKDEASFSNLLLAGTYAGICVTIDPVVIFLLPFILLYVLLTPSIYKSGNSKYHGFVQVKKCGVLLVPFFWLCFLILLYNWASFGSPFETGYSYARVSPWQHWYHPLDWGLYIQLFLKMAGVVFL